MIRLLRFLIWGDGHLCHWEDAGAKVETYVGDRLVRIEQPMKCSICGKRKSVEL